MFRALTASLLLVLLNVLAYAPGLHARLHGHGDDCGAEHGHGAAEAAHVCAVTLFAAGVETLGPPLSPQAPLTLCIADLDTSLPQTPVSASCRLQPPGRAPPC
jgi:hypothetical protein